MPLPTEMHNYVLQTDIFYLDKLLTYHGISVEKVPEKNFLKIKNFPDYNYLYDINSIFSTSPSGDVIDRTFSCTLPINMQIQRPWRTPDDQLTLDESIFRRVEELENKNCRINLFWSGGIDSTTMVVSFLKHSKNISNLRILFSTFSVMENPGFFLLLTKIKNLEMVEFSGDVYLTQNYDGIFLTGDGGDDLTASLDESFFKDNGLSGLATNWKDFFYKKNSDLKFIEFCEKYFSIPEKPIKTVLDARWWFYTNSKINKFPALASEILQFNQPLVIGFFDNYYFENFMFFNIEKIISDDNYSSYKNFMKEYIFDYDHNAEYQKNKTKFNSNQMIYYSKKKMALNNHRYIMLLGDGTRIQTDNLPFFNELEYRAKYKDSLDYLFNV